eukprot:m.300459 g.300459  ORF g.300459 m.300459 type:complete len:359 (+) comp14462_c0_seq1:188-1264(+)
MRESSIELAEASRRKSVEDLQKEDQLIAYQCSKSTSNKAAEICVTLLSLYLVLELQDIPSSCDTNQHALCMSNYLKAGGEPDPFLLLRDCGALKKLCDESFATEALSLLATKPVPDSIRTVNGTYSALLGLCECLIGDSTVDCSFLASRTIFLLLGILAIFLFEVSREAFPSVRMFVFLYTIIYFLLCLITYNREICANSEDFIDRREVIVFLCVVSIIVMSFAWILEILAKAGKVDALMQASTNATKTMDKFLSHTRTRHQEQDSNDSHRHERGHRGAKTLNARNLRRHELQQIRTSAGPEQPGRRSRGADVEMNGYYEHDGLRDTHRPPRGITSAPDVVMTSSARPPVAGEVFTAV